MSTVTSRDGAAIAYERSGAGPALIMVNGALAYRAMFPAPAEDAPTPRFTVIAYDRRGRGESGDVAPYAVEREIEDLAALIEAVGGSAFVFGHSSGAVLALEAARQLPSITKLAVYEPPFIVDSSRRPVPREYVRHLNELIAAGRRGDAVDYLLTEAVGMPADAVAGMRDMPMWSAFEGIAHTIPYDGAIMGDTQQGDPEALNRYASISIPTLVLDGGLSPEYMRNAARTLASVLPHAHYHTVEGQEHGISPEVLMPLLEAYLLD